MHGIFSLSIIVGMLFSGAIAYPEPRMPSKTKNFKIDLDRRPVIPSSFSDKQKSPSSLAAEDSAEVDLESVYVDVEYVGPISVGTPPVTFNMVLDTGSTDIWFPSVDCKTCGNHPRFDPDSSSSYTSLGREWSLGYFDGSYVKGVVGTDTIHIGDLAHENQIIGLATTESRSFARNGYLDGIFGLAFPAMSLTGEKTTIIMDMYEDGEIDEPVVGMHLGRTRDGGKGEAIFGGVNTDRFTGEPKYLDVTRQKYWQVDFNGLDIDGTLYTDDSIDQAMIDTGTTLTILPSDAMQAIHDSIPNGKYVDGVGWFFPCNSTVDITVTFKLGGHDFPVPVTELIRDLYLANDPTYCLSGVGETNNGLAIFGETFLRNYYSIYNFQDATVGLAPVLP